MPHTVPTSRLEALIVRMERTSSDRNQVCFEPITVPAEAYDVLMALKELRRLRGVQQRTQGWLEKFQGEASTLGLLVAGCRTKHGHLWHNGEIISPEEDRAISADGP